MFPAVYKEVKWYRKLIRWLLFIHMLKMTHLTCDLFWSKPLITRHPILLEPPVLPPLFKTLKGFKWQNQNLHLQPIGALTATPRIPFLLHLYNLRVYLYTDYFNFTPILFHFHFIRSCFTGNDASMEQNPS